MPSFTYSDIALYYDTTLVHFRKWWKHEKINAFHYGIWDDNTVSFSEALENTNRILAEIGGIRENEKVLDAGCGTGGSAVWLVKTKNADVTGITLSEKQVKLANEIAAKNNFSENIRFLVMDFHHTTFPDDHFDSVWACESICQSADKELFIKECYRILKIGGKLIMSDFFISSDEQTDRNSWIEKWADTWAVSSFISADSFVAKLKTNRFIPVETFDYTGKIQKTAHRLYITSILGAPVSEIYNLFNSNVSRFARNHYKCGYYQYKALKEGLWKYMVINATK